MKHCIPFIIAVASLTLLPLTLFANESSLNISANTSSESSIKSLFTSKELKWLEKKRALTYVYDPDWAPFEWKNDIDKHVGIIADILTLINKKVGIELTPINADTWEESVELVKNGKADMFSAITQNSTREDYLNFTSKDIYSYPAVLITKFDDKKVYLNFEKDFKGKKIGVVKGSGLGQYIKEKFPELEYVVLPATQDGFSSIRNNKIDMFAINTVTAKYFIEKKGFDDLKIALKLDYIHHLKIAIRKDLPSEILSILDKSLSSIREEELNDVFNKWTEISIKQQTDWKLLLQITGTLFIAITSIWLFSLRREVKARKKIEHELYASTQHLKLYRDQAPMATIEWNPDFQVVDWNKAAEKMLGYPLDEVKGRNFVDIMLPDSAVVDVKQIWEDLIAQTGGQISVNENLTKDGRTILCEWHNRPIVDESGNIIGAASIVQDITERKKAEEQMNYLAYYDYLTELPNRRLFIDRLQQAMKEAHRSEKLVALLLLDLDHFKRVNDSLGHEAGDLLLKEAALRLTNCLRESDTVARLGGDEFAFVMPSVNHLDDVIIVAKQIIKTISKTFLIKDTELFITASIGITLYPLDDDNADDLIRNSDTAMYHAKDNGRNNFQFYNHEMTIQVEEQLKLEEELRQALLQNEFVLFYQPKIDTENNSIVGMEALIRWKHPQRGLVAPDSFISTAEETGLIIPIGKWVLEGACKQTQLLNASGIVPIHVSVNLSVRQLEDPELVQIVEQTLKETKLNPALLDLEITESMLMSDMEKVIQTLKDLSSLGVTISVDDFGTGHSSLAYLKQFPISTLKIDRSFISDIPEDKDDMSITIAIIQMADALGLKTVAEGVETKEQLDFLKQHECNLIQGYYFSKPIAFKEIEKLFQVELGKDKMVKVNPAD